jgi:lactoylglutathione lyase
MTPVLPEPLFLKIDCLQIPVLDVEAGLAFYRDRLGHRLIWRSATSAGLRMPDTDAELVIQAEQRGLEANLLVDSAEAAAARFVEAGGQVVVPPFDIQIGRCVVVRDPWGNVLVLLDISKGMLMTDADGNIVGNAPIATRPSPTT